MLPVYIDLKNHDHMRLYTKSKSDGHTVQPVYVLPMTMMLKIFYVVLYIAAKLDRT